jgi:hypothetical protein
MKAGRHIFDGKPKAEVVAKLEEAWAIGSSDKEAALFASISPSVLCKLLQKDDYILKRKEELINRPFMKARRAIYAGLDKPEFALDFMERKKPDEFAQKQQVQHNVAIELSVVKNYEAITHKETD